MDFRIKFTALVAICGALWGQNAVPRLVPEAHEEVQLAAAVELAEPLKLPRQANAAVTIRGQARTLRTGPAFAGSALLWMEDAAQAEIADITLIGDRDRRPGKLYGEAATLTEHFRGHGIVLKNCRNVTIRNVTFRHIDGFAIAVIGGGNITIENVTVEDSGSLGPDGKNNTTGGVLLEEGVRGFRVEHSRFTRIRGNAVWTHAWSRSPRNADGVVSGNTIAEVGRDGIQIGHGERVRVEANQIHRVGYPYTIVDPLAARPVGIDTAGNTSETSYTANTLREINGTCIDLDGFHHGTVRGNTCINAGTLTDYPAGNYGIVFNNTDPNVQPEQVAVTENHLEGLRFGAVYLIGRGHTVRGNTFRRLFLAGCPDLARAECRYALDQPALLSSAIYLAAGGTFPDPARNNTVTANRLDAGQCLGVAPGVQVEQNETVEACRTGP